MALIGKIRQNMWFVFALLGVALIAFMMMDSSGPGGGGSQGSTAFSVNGDKVDVQQLQRLESIESNSTGITGNQLRSKVFDDLITRTLVSNEAEALGLRVSEEEMEDLLFGSRLSPVIQQLFRDPRTGTVNRQNLLDVKTNLDNGTVNQNFMALWNEKTKQAENLEIQNKIGTMVSKGIYTPTWMAEELSKTNSIAADIDYVKVPFSAVADNEISLTDADYKAYMEENKNLYNNKEDGRVVEYVVFDITPSAKDSADILASVTEKAIEFEAKTEGDSLYAVANGGNYVNFYFKTEDLPEAFQDVASEMEIGAVHGPIVNERYYSAMKLIDRKVVADSVKLSHIFRPVERTNTSLVNESIEYLDSLKNLIDRGIEEFDSLAIKYSQDPSTASKGGDLGYVTQGQFFPEINTPAFFTGDLNKVYRVQTDNGVHLIKITERRFTTEDPKFKVAFINTGIEPSQETVGLITNNAAEFISDNRDITTFRSNYAKYPSASLRTSKILKKKDYQFEEFEFADDARNIVLWAFNDNTDVGDVSPDMYTFRDELFNYESQLVIPALQATTSKGMSKLADVKNSISDQVMQYAKGQKIAEMMSGKAISELASMEGATTGNIPTARTSSAFLQEIGYQPNVVAAIIATPEGGNSEAIIGEDAVYKINVKSKTTNTASNSVFSKQSENMKARQNVNFLLFDAMKDNAEVKDKRMDFGM